VADDGAADAELEQDRRRDLAGERPLVLPVDVLGVDRTAACDRGSERAEGRADHDIDSGRRLERGKELPSLARALVHLPVGG
jgi:hypothetical protein